MRYLIVFKRFFIVIIALTFGAVQLKAQYDPSFSHYFDMETSFNPGAAGKQPKLNVTAAYALDMVGLSITHKRLMLRQTCLSMR